MRFEVVQDGRSARVRGQLEGDAVIDESQLLSSDDHSMRSHFNVANDSRRSAEEVRHCVDVEAVSIGLSYGRPWIRTHDGQGHEVVLNVGDMDYFRELKPVASAGYSIQIFHLTRDDVLKLSERWMKRAMEIERESKT